jgi:hypothetical protein
MHGAQARLAACELDLETRAAHALARAENLLSQLQADPERYRHLMAAVCELGGHLEDNRRALADYAATNRAAEQFIEAGRQLERDAAAQPKPKRRPRRETASLRLALP